MTEHLPQLPSVPSAAGVPPTPLPRFSVSSDGVILSVNSEAGRLLGYPLDQLVGRPVLDLYSDSPAGRQRARQLFERFREGESLEDSLLEMRRSDGSRVRVSLLARPVLDRQGRVLRSRSLLAEAGQASLRLRQLMGHTLDQEDALVGCLDDLEACRTEAERFRKDLERLEPQASLGRVSALVAHELRSSVGGLTLAAHNALDVLGLEVQEAGDRPSCSPAARTPTLEPEIGGPEAPKRSGRETAPDEEGYCRRALLRIARFGDRAGRLIDTTLRLVRGQSLRQEPVWLDGLVDRTVVALGLAQRARAQGIGLRVDPGAGERRVRAHSLALQQALSNLVDNALAAEGVTEVRIATRRRAERLEILVEDDGEGMGAEELRRYSDSFATGRGYPAGTGLGLSLVRIVMEQLGGELKVEDRPGGGTRFTLSLVPWRGEDLAREDP